MPSRTAITEVTLSDEESEGLRSLVVQVQADAYADDPSYYDAILAASLAIVPGRLRSMAIGFGDHLGAAGVLLFRGLPVSAGLPATPDSSDTGLRARSGAEAILIGLATLTGPVFGFPGWRDGHRVHNIFPLPEDLDTQKASSATRLEMHTEAAFAIGSPDALAIICLRSDKDGAPTTAFCDLRKAWDQLSAAKQALLAEPAFLATGPDWNQGESRGNAFAVTHLPGGTPTAKERQRFHYIAALRGATPDHEAALRSLKAGIRAATTEVTLMPGDLVLIDNTHVAHGRAPFTPRFDGTDRWLQRCLIRQAARSAHHIALCLMALVSPHIAD
jgi:L-asparagine oxygenase